MIDDTVRRRTGGNKGKNFLRNMIHFFHHILMVINSHQPFAITIRFMTTTHELVAISVVDVVTRIHHGQLPYKISELGRRKWDGWRGRLHINRA